MAVIYRITNKHNGKKYVGFTSFSAEERFQCHIQTAKHCNTDFAFHAALRKYGPESFTIEVLEESDDVDFLHNVREAYYITDENSMVPNGYNMQPGGEGNISHRGCKPVHCYDVNMNFIKEYNSISEAARDVKLKPSNVGGACARAHIGKSSKSGNYLWCYSTETPIKKDTTYMIDHNRKLSDNNKGKKRPSHSKKMKEIMKTKRDPIIYTFVNENGDTFTGTRHELQEYDNSVVISELGVLIRGGYKSHRGWSLKED